jgi:hypothetical protein
VFAGALVMQREHRPQDACVAVLDLILIWYWPMFECILFAALLCDPSYAHPKRL